MTESQTTRRRIHRISDNFLAFYVGTVERFRPEIERGLGESILGVLEQAIDDHMGPVWEAAFRDHVRYLAQSGEIGPGVVAVGPFWTDDGQTDIDAVALAGRGRRPALAGEAKWAKSISGPRVYGDLRAKALRLQGFHEELRYLLCARDSIRDLPEGVYGCTAADMFG